MSPHQRVLEAIADGQHNPKSLAALAAGQIKGGRAAVERAPEGMLPGAHHPMLIRLHLDHVTFLDRSIAAIEDEIDTALDAIEGAWGISGDGVPSPDPGPGAAALTAVERLAEIPGVSPKLAMAVIAETGLDMTRFPTADHLVSWAGLAPVARQSGPRNRKPKKGQGDAYLKGYRTQAANGAARTETFTPRPDVSVLWPMRSAEWRLPPSPRPSRLSPYRHATGTQRARKQDRPVNPSGGSVSDLGE
jgi:transposase